MAQHLLTDHQIGHSNSCQSMDHFNIFHGEIYPFKTTCCFLKLRELVTVFKIAPNILFNLIKIRPSCHSLLNVLEISTFIALFHG